MGKMLYPIIPQFSLIRSSETLKNLKVKAIEILALPSITAGLIMCILLQAVAT